MNNLHLLLLAFCLSFSIVLSASTGNSTEKTPDPKTTFNAEVTKLLADPHLVLKEDVMANVIFTLNENNELVVLSVDAEHEFIKDFVKQRLHSKKIKSKLSREIKEYKLPVKIRA